MEAGREARTVGAQHAIYLTFPFASLVSLSSYAWYSMARYHDLAFLGSAKVPSIPSHSHNQPHTFHYSTRTTRHRVCGIDDVETDLSKLDRALDVPLKDLVGG